MHEDNTKEFCVRFARSEDVKNIVCDKLDPYVKTDILLPKGEILRRIAVSLVWSVVTYSLSQRVIIDDTDSVKKTFIILSFIFILLSAICAVLANIIVLSKLAITYIRYHDGSCIHVKLQVQSIDRENDSITYVEPISGKFFTFYTICDLEETLEVGDTNEIIIIYK